MKFIARVPATKLGYVFIETLKEHLNTTDFKMVTRYTGKRRPSNAGHTKKDDAESIRVYLEPRNEPPRGQYEYVRTDFIHEVARENTDMSIKLEDIKKIVDGIDRLR